jgi:hypothetical protein
MIFSARFNIRNRNYLLLFIELRLTRRYCVNYKVAFSAGRNRLTLLLIFTHKVLILEIAMRVQSNYSGKYYH